MKKILSTIKAFLGLVKQPILLLGFPTNAAPYNKEYFQLRFLELKVVDENNMTLQFIVNGNDGERLYTFDKVSQIEDIKSMFFGLYWFNFRKTIKLNDTFAKHRLVLNYKTITKSDTACLPVYSSEYKMIMNDIKSVDDAGVPITRVTEIDENRLYSILDFESFERIIKYNVYAKPL